jgi:glycosyltransferase involved in cell wall biosynthesis
MTRLFLLFHGRFPGEKAASLFAAKSAEAFADKGLEVTVIVPRRKDVDAQAAFDYFGVKKNFTVVEVGSFDAFSIFPNKIAFWINFWMFSRAAVRYLKMNAKADDVIYSNESLPLQYASRFFANTFYEMHDFPESKLGFFGKFLSRMKWVLVHNKWKITKLYETFNIPEKRILYEPNAVDIATFNQDISAAQARLRLGLPEDKKIIVYTGHLYGWKGVDVLAQAADMLDLGFLVVFVGGTDKDVAAFRGTYGASQKVLIVGHKKHSEIPLWQKAADMLALPNSGKEAISLYYTSPMKLFEYMVSRKPIIASDIPSIREILNDKNAVLVPADNAGQLAVAIKTLAADQKTGDALAEQAFTDVASHTWEKRADRIISFIKS